MFKTSLVKSTLPFTIMLCLYSSLSATAQDTTRVADTTIHIQQEANRVAFSAPLPPLKQIPGAPEPFYTYLWDFGDGHFSTQEKPVHDYSKLSAFDVHLYAVNNYDDGKKPQKRKIKVKVETPPSNIASASPAERDFFKANGIFELKYNCMAKPNDTMVLIAGWKNTDALANGGKLYLLINEKLYEQTCFDTAAFRFYNNDSLVSNRMMATLAPQTMLTVTESGSPASRAKQLVGNYNAEAQSLFFIKREFININQRFLKNIAGFFIICASRFKINFYPRRVEPVYFAYLACVIGSQRFNITVVVVQCDGLLYSQNYG